MRCRGIVCTLAPVVLALSLVPSAQAAWLQSTASAGMHLVYNSRSGELFYDADGFGAGNGAVLLAIFGTTTHPALVAADFMQ